MTRTKFYEALAEMLDTDPSGFSDDSVLKDLPGWDSLAVLSFVAMADSSLNTIVSGAALVKCKTVGDLIALLPGKIED